MRLEFLNTSRLFQLAIALRKNINSQFENLCKYAVPMLEMQITKFWIRFYEVFINLSIFDTKDEFTVSSNGIILGCLKDDLGEEYSICSFC